MTTLSDIIAMESQSKYNNDNATRLKGIWSKTKFFNISYNTTKMSSEDFPMPGFRGVNLEFKNKLGVGLQWGRTFNFHKRPLGDIVYIGLDYTWMDLNFNQYNSYTLNDNGYKPDGSNVDTNINGFNDSELNESETGKRLLPWNHKKMTLDYGMSIGPSLTFYPFTPIHSDITDKIRFNFYFHVGYCASGTLIKDVLNSDGKTKEQFAWGHGLYTSYGGSLTWNSIGIGYEWRDDSKLTYKAAKKDFDSGDMKIKQKITRVYLQFRF
jgi:hypothetical protein